MVQRLSPQPSTIDRHPTMPGTRFIAAGTVLATLAVAAGAFGAHAMKHRVAADDLAIFNPGVQYPHW